MRLSRWANFLRGTEKEKKNHVKRLEVTKNVSTLQPKLTVSYNFSRK